MNTQSIPADDLQAGDVVIDSWGPANRLTILRHRVTAVIVCDRTVSYWRLPDGVRIVLPRDDFVTVER